MWMGRSLEANGTNESTRIHSRVSDKSESSWKGMLVQNTQWLGEKVMEVGGKLVRRGSHSTIPDRPVNDGRANWMSDIRNATTSGGNHMNFSGNNAYSSGYQNEYSTGHRPTTYSDAVAAPLQGMNIDTAMRFCIHQC